MVDEPEAAVNNSTPDAVRRERGVVGHLVGEDVVIDTDCSMTYIGRLVEWGEFFVTLADADVHDIAQGTSTKDMYAIEARKHGVQRNRRETIIRKARVISLSLLDDVIEY